MRWLCFIVLGLVWTTPILGALAQEPPQQKNDRSNPSNVFAFNVKILGEDGSQIQDPVVESWITTPLLTKKSLEVEAQVDGSVIIKVPGKEPWWTVDVSATSADKTQRGNFEFSGRKLRTIVRDGLELKLSKQDEDTFRTWSVAVTAEGAPVANATVKAVTPSELELKTETDANGMAEIRMPRDEPLMNIAAWHGTSWVGGVQMSRRQPVAGREDLVGIQLSATHPITIQVVDEEENPIPDISFTLEVWSKGPEYKNIIGYEHAAFVTDAQGEAVVEWFPDWEDPNYRLRLETDQWLVRDSPRPKIEENRVKVVLKKSAKSSRRRVSGIAQLEDGSPASGFHVVFRSFEGEVKNRSDLLFAFTDDRGKFSFDVLPDATYCYYVDDTEMVSNQSHAIMFDTKTGTAFEPKLTVVPGEKVVVKMTGGHDKRPRAGQVVNLRSVYQYNWIENGRTQRGNTGRSWQVTTDANGVANTIALPGALEASVYTSDWSKEESIDVRAGAINEVVIHRPTSEPVTVQGRLSADSQDVLVANAKVTVAAVDGNTEGQSNVNADQAGAFEFETKSSQVALFAMTADKQHTASSIVEIPVSQPVRLQFTPTLEYRGTLLGESDEPLADTLVRARVELELERTSNTLRARRLNGPVIESRTDAEGNFLLTGIPTGIRVVMEYLPNKSTVPVRIGERYLVAGEIRPVDIHRTARQTAEPISYPDFFAQRLVDCKSYSIYTLVAIVNDPAGTELVTEVFAGSPEYRAIYGYLPLLIDLSQGQKRREGIDEALQTHKITKPEPGQVGLYVLDGDGTRIAETSLDPGDADSLAAGKAFVNEHEPAAGDALVKIQEAMLKAKDTGRVVWAQHSQTRCGPCFALTRWIEKHRSILEKQFVFVKIDDVRDANGIEIAQRITGGRNFGIPFVAIMGPAGELIIDGEGPLGNIGFPSSFEGIQHLKKMIEASGDQLSDEEIEQLVSSLQD